MIVYFNGEFMPKDSVCISPDDRGFLFGDGVYEVLRAHRGRLFAAEAHFARLRHSLRELEITQPDIAQIQGALHTLIQRNDLEAMEVIFYIQITRGSAPRRHAFPQNDVPPTVYITARAFQPRDTLLKHGIKIILVPDTRWTRCDIKSVNLLPNVLANQQAREAGAYDAVFVREGVLLEGAHTSFCAVFDGGLVTHPLSPHILPGVTRDIVLKLCQALDIPFREVPIALMSLPEAGEVMLLGTTTEVMPVTHVDDWQVGDGFPGPITQTLQEKLHQMIQGQYDTP